MQPHRPVRAMRTVLGAVAVAALLAAVGGAVDPWAGSAYSGDVTLNPTALTQTLSPQTPPPGPFRESVTPDGRGGDATVIEQVGTVVSISDWTLTAASSDGTVTTYVITPRTTAVTLGADSNHGTNLQFHVNDVVSIVGTLQNGTAFATVVAALATTNGNGPPMDG